MTNIFEPDFLNFSDEMEGDAEFIPLITQEEEDIMNKQDFPTELPIYPTLSTQSDFLQTEIINPIPENLFTWFL
jgi:hypothetical protein